MLEAKFEQRMSWRVHVFIDLHFTLVFSGIDHLVNKGIKGSKANSDIKKVTFLFEAKPLKNRS